MPRVQGQLLQAAASIVLAIPVGRPRSVALANLGASWQFSEDMVKWNTPATSNYFKRYGCGVRSGSDLVRMCWRTTRTEGLEANSEGRHLERSGLRDDRPGDK